MIQPFLASWGITQLVSLYVLAHLLSMLAFSQLFSMIEYNSFDTHTQIYGLLALGYFSLLLGFWWQVLFSASYWGLDPIVIHKVRQPLVHNGLSKPRIWSHKIASPGSTNIKDFSFCPTKCKNWIGYSPSAPQLAICCIFFTHKQQTRKSNRASVVKIFCMMK